MRPQSCQLGWADVAAAADDRHLAAREPPGCAQYRREGGRALLASGGVDYSVRLWDPRTGGQLVVLEGHQGPVRAVCPVTVDGRALLASGCDDDTVRLWDPRTSICLLTARTHHKVLAVAGVTDALAIGLDIGILVIKPSAVV